MCHRPRQSSHCCMMSDCKLSAILRLSRPHLTVSGTTGGDTGLLDSWYDVSEAALPKVGDQLGRSIGLAHNAHQGAAHHLSLRALPLGPLHGGGLCVVAPVPVLPRSCVVVELIEAAHVRETLRSLLNCFHLQTPTTSGFLPSSSVTQQSNGCTPLVALIFCLEMFCQPESPRCYIRRLMCCITAPHLLLRDANAGSDCGQGSGCKRHPAQQVYMTFHSRWVATTRVVIQTCKTLASAPRLLMGAGTGQLCSHAIAH